MEVKKSLVKILAVLSGFAGLCAISACVCADNAGKIPEPMLLKKNGGWCWYQGPRAVSSGDSIVFASVKSPEGDVDIGSWNIKTQKVQNCTLMKNFNSDDHACASILKLPSGKLLTAWASHGNEKDKKYKGAMFSAFIKGADCIDSVGPVRRMSWGGGFCYTNIFRLSAENGRIYDFSRSVGFNPNWYYSDDNGLTFNYGGRFLFWKFDKSDPKKTKLDGNRPYVKYASNNVDTVFFAATEDHPRAYDNSIYFGFMRGGKMYKAEGVEVCGLSALPDRAPSPVDFTRVFEGDAEHVAWIIDLKLDSAGRPVILFSVQVGCGALRNERSHKADGLLYYYARFDGAEWVVNPMAHAGSALYESECDYTGLCSVNPADADEVFVSANSHPASGLPLVSSADGKRHYEIFSGRTADFGRTWKWRAVTENSSCDNLRPIAVAGAKNSDARALLWLRGSLNTYMDYSLDVVGTPLPLR